MNGESRCRFRKLGMYAWSCIHPFFTYLDEWSTPCLASDFGGASFAALYWAVSRFLDRFFLRMYYSSKLEITLFKAILYLVSKVRKLTCVCVGGGGREGEREREWRADRYTETDALNRRNTCSLKTEMYLLYMTHILQCKEYIQKNIAKVYTNVVIPNHKMWWRL